MKYIYILLCALSSFLCYKSLHANEIEHFNAFFIPENAINQNTSVKELTPPSEATPKRKTKKRIIRKKLPAKRNVKQVETIIDTPTQTTNATNVPNTSNTSNTSTPKKSSSSDNTTLSETTSTKTFPVEKTTLTKTLPQKSLSSPRTSSQVQKIATPQPTQKNKYELDDNILSPTHSSSTPDNESIIDNEEPTIKVVELSHLEKLKNTPLADLLSEIPYPSNTPPLYKQLYFHHIMDLRTLYRTGKLFPSQELEETLSKLNSLNRFEVTDSPITK